MNNDKWEQKKLPKKMTKEARLWVKQSEVRLESCREAIKEDLLTVKSFEKQTKLCKKRIELEKKQIELIKKDVERYIKSWN